MTWRERLTKLTKATDFTCEDLERSKFWATCAVGEQHQQLPDVVVYTNVGLAEEVPIDFALGSLGQRFYKAIRSQQPIVALTILDQIEDRVLELKREKGS